MKFVIAGDYAEYYDFLRRKSLPRSTTLYIFISDPLRLYNLTDIQVTCVGRFWKSPVYRFHYKDRVMKKIVFIDEHGKEVTTQHYWN